ncbi:Fanconi anemia group C protein [Natator depressus]|uniref:Fanconi anemia group C protein n=1 Tax=Natator depressus TaxID=27790 RepID=UPI003EBAE029
MEGEGMAQDTAVPKMSFQYWLDKAVEWGQTTTLESQQDVCLHLPKLQEFLQQIYESLKHMNSTTAIQRFPLIGQLLGRLCWNPFVVGYDESQKTLMWCLCCLYSNEPQNPVELKANSWILSLLCHLLSSSWGANEVGTGTFISAVGCTSADYYSKLVKNIVSSLVTELRGNQFNGLNIQGRVSDDHVTVVSLFCVPLITLPDVTPLLEALLTYHGGGSQEVLSSEFLEAVNETFLKKKIALSESAILSLWLRHLPSLEKATLHLFERLISTQTSSLEQVVCIIKDSLLPQAACHPAIFKIVDEIFKNALLETGGTPEVMTIIQMFTQCFVQAHQKDNKQTNTAVTLKPVIMQGTAFSRMEWKSINCMKKLVQIQTDIIFLSKCKQMDIVPKGLKHKFPLKAYFPHHHQHLVIALLKHPFDLPATLWSQHLKYITDMLKAIIEDKSIRSYADLFESWFLFVHFGEWADIAVEQLLKSEDESSDTFLWLLAFYYSPHNDKEKRTQIVVEARAVYDRLMMLFSCTTLSITDLQAAASTKTDKRQPCTKHLVRHLLLSFLLFSSGGHKIAQEFISHVILASNTTNEVFGVLIRTAYRFNQLGLKNERAVKLVNELLQELRFTD